MLSPDPRVGAEGGLISSFGKHLLRIYCVLGAVDTPLKKMWPLPSGR